MYGGQRRLLALFGLDVWLIVLAFLRSSLGKEDLDDEAAAAEEKETVLDGDAEDFVVLDDVFSDISLRRNRERGSRERRRWRHRRRLRAGDLDDLGGVGLGRRV
ncbi:hypothetical protein ACLB2K_023396 [Fragaria x ananassa]